MSVSLQEACLISYILKIIVIITLAYLFGLYKNVFLVRFSGVLVDLSAYVCMKNIYVFL
jgi:hypothetical protein